MLKTPSNPDIQKLHAWVDAHQDEIISSLQGVLRIPSLEAAAEGTNAPFGAEVRRALDFTLQHALSLGFRTKDVGPGFAGHAEFGQGDEMVAAMGHLDVVPEGGGWRYDPYGAEIADGYIYARGSSDDKGPTWAALYGAKALMECGLPLKRRVRVIFGCNEESGFQCVNYYWGAGGEERPAYAFTPDASFPLIYAEKGIVNLTLVKKISTATNELRILSAKGGNRPNMVPDHAEATLTGTPASLLKCVTELQRFWDKNISFELEADQLTIHATGKSAHGSTPTLGDNAIARLARTLTLFDLAEKDQWINFVSESSETTGTALGIAHTDSVAGPLTNNLGMLSYAEGGEISLTYNIRYPVTWSLDKLLEANKSIREESGWSVGDTHNHDPLYVPLDKEPAATLLRVYREATGDDISLPSTTGGGTYARATPNAVAYGAGLPAGGDGPPHEPDERIAITTVITCAKIYAQALYELANI